MDPHADSMYQLAALSTVATLSLAITTLVPAEPLPVTASTLSSNDSLVLKGLWLAQLALYSIASVIAFSTPFGPDRYFPVTQIYSEKTVEAITNQDSKNVCGLVGMCLAVFGLLHRYLRVNIKGASIWDTLLFSYTTKVVMLGNIATSLEIGK